MKNAFLLTIPFLLVSMPIALADQPVSAAEIKKLISGKTVTIGNQNAFYGADGNYTFSNGNPGKWRISSGRICVDFNSGAARCDQIVRDNGHLYFVTVQGFRSQFKPQ